MKVIICKNYDDMSRRAASLLLAQLVTKPNSILGLATGSTPVGLYKELIGAYSRGEADFSSAASFNLDEYLGIPNTDPNSYFSFMQENLFRHINLLKENTHLPNGMAADAQELAVMPATVLVWEVARPFARIEAAEEFDANAHAVSLLRRKPNPRPSR